MKEPEIETDYVAAVLRGRRIEVSLHPAEPDLLRTAFKILISGVLIGLLVLLASSAAHAMDEADINMLADAIYRIEGGRKAKKPYGILSVPCATKAECREICKNTIRNNYRRYVRYGHKTHTSFTEFLASRYAPMNVKNDPKKLNRNWHRNLLAVLEAGQ